MNVELTKDYVIYQAQTRLLELGAGVAATKNWSKVKDKIDLGIKIRLWLKALQYSDYLTKPVIDRLVYTLTDLCDANAIPYAPVVTTVDPPDILVGIPGRPGADGLSSAATRFSVEDVDSTSVIDSFLVSQGRGVEYIMNIYDDDGSDMRTLRLQGGWTANGSVYGDDGGLGHTIQGDCSGITMSIVVAGGTTVRLTATVTSGSWTIEGIRRII